MKFILGFDANKKLTGIADSLPKAAWRPLQRSTGKTSPEKQRVRRESRNRIIKMEFWTYLNSLMLLPAQIVRGARRRVFRILTYRPGVDLLFMMHDHLSMPLRC